MVGCISAAPDVAGGADPSSYFPPETTTSLSLAATHLLQVEVGHHRQQQQEQELTELNWQQMAGKGDGWAGEGWGSVGDAPSRCLVDQGLADEQGVGAGAAAKVRLGGETATRH